MYFLIPKGNRPRDRRKHIAADIKGKQLPEFHRHIAVKISVHHAGRKPRSRLGAPDNPVELLPRVAKVITVKVYNDQFSLFNHHVADVVVAMLVGLGPSRQQMAVFFYIGDNILRALKMDRTFLIHFDFPIHLPVKTGFPVRQIFRGWNGVDFFQYPSRVQAIGVLFRFWEMGDYLFRILPINPGLDAVYPLFTPSKFHRLAHGDSKGGGLLLHLEHVLTLPAFFFGGKPDEIPCPVGSGHTVFDIHRPTLVDGLKGCPWVLFPDFGKQQFLFEILHMLSPVPFWF